jgi:folate-binding protein YgfZ
MSSALAPEVLAEYDHAHKGAVFFDVSGRGKIEAAGNDAVVFLHNLSTNDVKNLPPGGGCELFFCTATAKAVAYGRVYREAPQGKRDRLWIDVGGGQGEKLFRHLDHFIIGEDVTLTDHTEALAQFHLAGPLAGDVIADAIGWHRPDGWAAHSCDCFHFLDHVPVAIRASRLIGLPGFDLICPAVRKMDLRQLIATGAVPAGRETYEVLRVESGMPEYGRDIDETTFAPEVGRTDAISYQKGCFLGQEPIVMARDRGVVQRTLIGLVTGDQSAPRGAQLYREGKEVGRVTSAAYSPRLGCHIALGYARRGSQTPGMELELEDNGVRRPVKVAKLPFE